MNIRYAISEIRKHGLDPYWMRQRFLTRVVSKYYDTKRDTGTRIHEEDWDNLLILDACRYDLFEEALVEYDLSGKLSKRHSLESGTPGFLAENFLEGTFHDIVYVTSNPYVNTDLEDDTFHDVVSVWKDGWDEDLQVVTPKTMYEYAIKAAEKYPDKRLIIHFVQPHAPFIGEKRLGDRKMSAIREEALGDEINPKERKATPFELLARGEISREQVWEAYLSNLRHALPYVDNLLHELRGLNVVTSDHGNAIGEFAKPFPLRVYGHPLGIKIPALTEVPWLEHQNGDRKEITEESPIVVDGDVDEETEKRLRMLGYTE